MHTGSEKAEKITSHQIDDKTRCACGQVDVDVDR